MNNLIFFDKTYSMPCYKVTKADLAEAETEYKKRFSKNNLMNSKTVYDRKDSRIAGILGEIVFKKIYPESKKSFGDLTYDFDYKKYKVDVKCKYRTVKPSLNFEASFFLYQVSEKFHANMYYFMSTLAPFEYVWLCGYSTKKDILNNPHSEIWHAGEIDPSNKMNFKEDTLCLKYKYIKQITVE